MVSEAKILTLDIENTPLIVPTFSLFKNDAISHKNIIKDWYLLSVAWKWLGEKKVYSKVIKTPEDDFEVAKAIYDAIEEADVLLGHNLAAFDWPKLNTRFLAHGLGPLPKKQIIDTYKIAKREFKFTSNRLDYLGEYLGLGGKMDTPPGLWLRCMAGDKKSLKLMEQYNKQDVVLTEQVYLKLRPYSHTHINLSREEHQCPKCQGHRCERRGKTTLVSGVFQRYQCKDCGGWSRGRKNLQEVKTKGLING